MKKYSHAISLSLMVMAFLIAAREYYVGYEAENALNLELELLHSQGQYPGQTTSPFDNIYKNLQDKLTFDDSQLSGFTSAAGFIFSQAKLTLLRERVLQVGRGDTIATILSDLGVSKKEIDEAIKALQKCCNPRDLKVGQTISVCYQGNDSEETVSLLSLEFKPSAEHRLTLTRDTKGRFKAEKKAIILAKVLKRVEGVVKSSFYNSVLKKDVPQKIVHEAIMALSYSVNLSHDLKSGDPFELLYEEQQDAYGNTVKSGEIKYVSILAGGQVHRLYKFTSAEGVSGYYTDKGESIVRALLQTPIDPSKSRVTSKFGRRAHPLKSYTREHKGVDFGAPVGTTIMAAGDGIVVKAGYNGDYGNYIKIKHTTDYETAYAHLSRFSPQLRVGVRVKQRQVIGYVGTTGLSTGPHLHFEVIYKREQIDPQKIKQFPTTHLVGREMQRFNLLKKDISGQIVGFPQGAKNQIVQTRSVKLSKVRA
ncbi:MAG: M23 family metallopeptidase [Alphaproteobacteria bacterium]|nr:M23 family metallopeptidase [Alphaproteobacteria bacterium]